MKLTDKLKRGPTPPDGTGTLPPDGSVVTDADVGPAVNSANLPGGVPRYRYDEGSVKAVRAQVKALGYELPADPDPNSPAFKTLVAELSKTPKNRPLVTRIQGIVRDRDDQVYNKVIAETANKTSRQAALGTAARNLVFTTNDQNKQVVNKKVVGAIGALTVLLLFWGISQTGGVPKPKPVVAVTPGVTGTVDPSATATFDPSGAAAVTPVVPSTGVPDSTGTSGTGTGTDLVNNALATPTTDLQPASTGSSAAFTPTTYQPPVTPTQSYSSPTVSTPTQAYEAPAQDTSSSTPAQGAVALPTQSAGQGTGPSGYTQSGTGTTATLTPPTVPVTPTTPVASGITIGRAQGEQPGQSNGTTPLAAPTLVRAQGVQGTQAAQGTGANQAGSSQAGANQAGANQAGTNQANTGTNQAGQDAQGPVGSTGIVRTQGQPGQTAQGTPATFTLVRANAKEGDAGTAPSGQGQTTGQAGTASSANNATAATQAALAQSASAYDQIYGQGASQAAAQAQSGPGQTAQGQTTQGQMAQGQAGPPAYVTGQKLRARLETGVSSVLGVAGLPVYARSEDGTLWRGYATATPEKRMNIIFDYARTKSGMEIPLSAAAYDLRTFVPGLAANIKTTAPTLAQDLINSTLSGFKTYAAATLNASTTTYANGVSTVATASPSLGTVLAGSAAGVFNVPNPSGSFITLLEEPVGSDLMIVVGPTGGGAGTGGNAP